MTARCFDIICIMKRRFEMLARKVVDPYILERSDFYIPYIFMEWDWEDNTCVDLANILHSAGYKPWFVIFFGFNVLSFNHSHP